MEAEVGWFVFIDEPGDHQLAFPYGILAGVAIEDRHVWPLARKLKDAETQFFGKRLEHLRPSFSADKALSSEVIQIGQSTPPMSVSSRVNLTKEYFSEGSPPRSEHIVAVAQSFFEYCRFVLQLLNDFDSTAFAVLMPIDEIGIVSDDRLRRDYVLFFERLSYFIAGQLPESTGLLVLDGEYPHISILRSPAMIDYFEKATKGRQRSRLLIPEPLIAGQSLATISNAARLLSYVVSCGFRLPKMTVPRRPDLDPLLKSCNRMRFSFKSDTGLIEWSFRYVDSLR